MRQPRIGRADRSDQGVDDFALDAVVQMPGIRDIRKTAPAIGNLLVLGERVGDEGKGPLILLEGLRQRLPGGLTFFGRAVLQQVQRRLDREFLAADLEAQAGDGLVEQPVPGRITALRLFVKQLLDAILELIRLVLAQILDPRPVIAEFGRLHRAFDHGVVDAIEFECEKQQMHRGIGQLLGNVTIEFGDRGIDAVAGMNKARIGAETTGEIVDRLIASDGLREPAAAVFACDVFRKFAFVVGLKRDAFRIHSLQITRDFRRVDAGIEIGQIPFRQFVGFPLGRGLPGVRLADGGSVARYGFAGCFVGSGLRRSGGHEYFQIGNTFGSAALSD